VPNAEGLYGMRIRYGDLTHEQAFTPDRCRRRLRPSASSRSPRSRIGRSCTACVSLVRRALWEAGTLPHRVLLAAETGTWGSILSQNLVVRAVR
jgi:hypothetical protein